MNGKNKREYVDEDDITIYDPTDDEFDDEVIEETSESNADLYKNFEQHEIWDEVDGEWFMAWLPKGSVKPMNQNVTSEANTWPVTFGVLLGVLAIITLAIAISCWLYS